MFEQRLYRLRKERGISQEELADIVGVSRQAVQKWESGASQPNMDNLVAISTYFGVTLDYLLKGTQPPPAGDPPQTQTVYVPMGWHYEYKSRRTLLGLPLVHVNLGRYGIRWARGIIAVGNVATGGLAVGGLSPGLSPSAAFPWEGWRWAVSPRGSPRWAALPQASWPQEAWLSAGWRWAASRRGSTPWAARRWGPTSPQEGLPRPISPSGTRWTVR